jgi:hypothetical protein
MMEVLVREQAAVQRDRFASFRLLEQIAEMLERSSPQQAGVVLMEGPAAAGTEVVPVIFADVERAWTPLFLRDSVLKDMPFALEASKDSEEDSGHGSGNEGSGNGNEGGRSKNKAGGSEGSNDGSFGAMDGDAMVE